MNTKNIQLSIIAALLFTLNVLFYYFFNQIAFIINYSNRSYTTEHFAGHQSIKVPILTAEVYSLLFPILRPANTQTESNAEVQPVSTLENIQVINTLDNNAAPIVSATVINKKNIDRKIPAALAPLNATAATGPEIQAPVTSASATPVLTPQADDASEEVNAPVAKNTIGHVSSDEVKNIPVTRSVSNDANVAGKMVTINGQNSLMVYPTNSEWHEMFVILNLTPSDKTPLKSIITPDFDGVVYPSTQKGELELHGTKYKITLVKLKGHNPNSSYPYFLSLASTNTFFIFGDYSDKTKWYIYENDRVSQYNSSSEIHLF